MKSLLYLVMIICTGITFSCNKDQNYKSSTPFDLFYGMEGWYNGSGEYTDSVLDTIKGLEHREFSSYWNYPPENYRFNISLGIYMDSTFPGEALRKEIIWSIEKFAHENAKKHRVTVATSDGLEQIIIRGEGCFLLSAGELEKEIEESSRRLWQDYEGVRDKGKNYALEKGTDL